MTISNKNLLDEKQCVFCRNKFGIYYNQHKTLCAQPNKREKSKNNLEVSVSQSVARLPYKLNCRHSTCNYCLLENESKNSVISCPACKNSTTSVSSVKLDFKKFGQICFEQFNHSSINVEQEENQKHTEEINARNGDFVKAYIRSSIVRCYACIKELKSEEKFEFMEDNTTRSNNNKKLCFDEDEDRRFLLDNEYNDSTCAQHYCKECHKFYCNSCFEHLHGYIHWHHHQSIRLENLASNFCKSHNGVEDIICLQDFELNCHKCVLNDHHGHGFMTIFSKSVKKQFFDSYIENLSNLIQKIKQLLCQTQLQLSFLKKKFQLDGSKSNAKSPLQVNPQDCETIRNLNYQKNELLQRLNIFEMFEREFRVYHINSKFIFIETIEKKAKDILDFFNDTDTYINMPMNGINPSTCLYEVNYQLGSERDEEETEEEEVEAEEVDNEDKSSQDYPIASNRKEEANTLSKRKFKRNKREKQHPEKRLFDKTKNNKKSCESSERSDSNFSLAENFASNSKVARLDVDYVFQGKITYAKDPSCLWVQINDRKFSNELGDWCTQVESLYDSIELSKLCEGELACYHHQKFNVWTRVRIEKLFQSEIADMRQHECLISPIDFGGYFKVKLGELRKCLPCFSNIEPNCIKAYLHYLKPYGCSEEEKEVEKTKENVSERIETSQWSDECAFLIKAWIEYFDYTIKILSCDENKTCFGIDLFNNIDYLMRNNRVTAPVANFYNIQSISLCETLVMFKLAKYLNDTACDTQTDQLEMIPRDQKKFTLMEQLRIEERFVASVSHFGELNDTFYMKKIYTDCDMDMSFAQLTQRMQVVYNSNQEELFKIFDPKERMIVAAKFRHDHKWYRGEIAKIYPNTMNADVMFVDFGTVEQYSLLELRYLKKEFAIDEVLTFKCQLFGLKFVDEDSLNKANDYMYELLKNITQSNERTMMVHVKNVKSNNSSVSIDKYTYEVILRYSVNDQLVNVNIALVKLGLAECIDMAIYENENRESDLNTGVIMPKKAPKPTKLEKEAKNLVKMSNKPVQSKLDNHVVCKVTNAVSPDEIWVQNIADCNHFFAKLQADLAERYTAICKDNCETSSESQASSSREWSEGEFCVVKVNKRAEFYRAKILSKGKNGKYKVFYLDNGFYENNVAEMNIYELVDEFNAKPEYKAKRCSLSGIQSLGTTNGEWSNLAKRFTHETLNEHFVHVIFNSEENGVFDVSIYIDIREKSAYDIYPHLKLKLYEEATSTSQSEFVLFADILVAKGLAIPSDKFKSIDKILSKQTTNSSHKSLLNLNQVISPCGKFCSYPNGQLPENIKSNFTCTNETLVTHVDLNNELIYVQFLRLNSFKLINEMSNEMAKTIKNVDQEHLIFTAEFLDECLKENPQTYQACVCLSKNRYLRGEVKARDVRNSSLFLVKFVDYGNERWMSFEKIYRPLIKYLNTTRQVFKVKVNAIYREHFRDNFKDELRELVYNKLIRLKIESIQKDELSADNNNNNNYHHRSDDILMSDFFLKNKQCWISDYFNRNYIETKMNIANEKEVDFVRLTESELDLFDNDTFNVIVSWIESFEKIWLQFVNNPNDTETADCGSEVPKQAESKNQKLIAEYLHRLEQQNSELFDLYTKNQLRNIEMENLHENMPCVGLYRTDGQLYRAKVMRINLIEAKCEIRYVDFGNQEIVDLSDVFYLDSKFMNLPEQVICVRLKDIAFTGENFESQLNDNKEFLLNKLYQCLVVNIPEDAKMLAKFNKKNIKEECLQVELYLKDSNSKETECQLAYESLIDEGILISLNSTF